MRVVVVKADVHALLALPFARPLHNRVVGRRGPPANAAGCGATEVARRLRLSDEARLGPLPQSPRCPAWRIMEATGVARGVSDRTASGARTSRDGTRRTTPGLTASVSSQLMRTATAEAWADALAREINERRRAECMARIQRDTVQLAIDLLVREPDIAGFFRVFIKTLVEESESHACGVWLLNRRAGARRADVRPLDGARSRTASSPETAPGGTRWRCRARACPLTSWPIGRAGPRSCSYDRRRRRACRSPSARSTRRTASTRSSSRRSSCRRATWDGSRCRADGHRSATGAWHRALLDAMARQATLALHQSQLAEQSRSEARRQAVLEERNRLARDIHDTLAQGFAAILMQLQGAQRSAASLPPAVARSIDTAVDSRADAHGRSAPVGLRAASAGARRRRRRRARAAWSSSRGAAPTSRSSSPWPTCRRSRAAPIARFWASRRKR